MSSTGPSIGVVIPTYNSGRYVKECLLSVLQQKYRPTQVVICDDGSDDDTLSVIEEIKCQTNGPIEIVRHKHNIGIPKNFNSGLKRITTEYVSLIAGDDMWHPEKLQHEIDLLKNGVGAVYSACSIIDEHGNFLGPFKRRYDGVKGNILFEMLMHELAFRSPLLKMSLIRAIGYYDERFDIFEDWDLKIKYVARVDVEYSPVNTVYYRRHDAGVSKVTDHWKCYKSLKMVYDSNKSLIKVFDVEQRQRIAYRRKQDLLRHLRDASGEIFNRNSLRFKLQWCKEYLTLDFKGCVKILLILLGGRRDRL